MILVDPDDLAAHPTRDLAQLAFLVGGGLIKGGDSQIENRSAHGCSSLRGHRKIGHPKWRVSLGFPEELFGGFFRTPGVTPLPPPSATSARPRAAHSPGRGLNHCTGAF